MLKKVLINHTLGEEKRKENSNSEIMACINEIVANAFLNQESKQHITERHIFCDWNPEDKKSQFVECSAKVFERIRDFLAESPEPDEIQNDKNGIFVRTGILRKVYDEVVGIDHDGKPLRSMYLIVVASGWVVTAYAAKLTSKYFVNNFFRIQLIDVIEVIKVAM